MKIPIWLTIRIPFNLRGKIRDKTTELLDLGINLLTGFTRWSFSYFLLYRRRYFFFFSELIKYVCGRRLYACINTQKFKWVCGRAVTNTSKSVSGGPGFKPRSSRCFLGQGTLLNFVSLHPGVPATPISFCKRSLPFLTVDATIANEAFSSDRWIKLQ